MTDDLSQLHDTPRAARRRGNSMLETMCDMGCTVRARQQTVIKCTWQIHCISVSRVNSADVICPANLIQVTTQNNTKIADEVAVARYEPCRYFVFNAW